MQERYSSVAGDEVWAALAKVSSLAGFRRDRRERNPESGYGGGYAVADSTVAEKGKPRILEDSRLRAVGVEGIEPSASTV
jgi:hypothetical protein